MSFWKRRKCFTAADMTAEGITQSRSSSTLILLGCLSRFSIYEFYVPPYHKTPGAGDWVIILDSLTDLRNWHLLHYQI